jgi:glycosyltransferase involved in cell wall biosynthesis
MPRKNHIELIHIARQLSDMGISFDLTIVGEVSSPAHVGYHEACVRAIEELGLQDIVQLKINLRHDLVLEMMEDNDLFLMLSSEEPASISHIEAMGKGMAVVVTADNGTATYVQPTFGRICPNVSDVVGALEEILRHPGQLQSMRRNAYAFALENLTPEAVANEFIEVLGLTTPRRLGPG